jgi:hypothetical protein
MRARSGAVMDGARYHRENTFLRATARLAPDIATLLPDGSLDWAYVRRAADKQGITPLLHTVLQTPALPVPPTVTANLHATYWQSHFRNRALLTELARILDAAGAAKVDAMPLKGAVLAPLYYPTAALRPLSDLDFMVRPDGAARFAALLRDLGYREEFVPPVFDPHMKRPVLREWKFARTMPEATPVVEYRIEPLDPGVGALIAYDPTLVTRHLRHADGMWARARRETFDGAALWRIAPEDLLLHVASHLATRHAGYRLLWLHDLCRIAAAHVDDLDWVLVAAEARSLRLHASVFAALEAARDWLDAPIPLDTIAPYFLDGSRRGVSMSHIEYRLLTSHRARKEAGDLTREPLFQWWLLAGSLLRLRGIRPYLRAVWWTLMPGRVYIAAWRSRPEDTSLRGYLSGLLLRVCLGVIPMIGEGSRRAHVPILAAWCDRVLRRSRPFAISRPDDAGTR